MKGSYIASETFPDRARSSKVYVKKDLLIHSHSYITSFLKQLTKEQEAAIHPAWRIMAILLLVVAVLLASTSIALCAIICHSRRGLKSLKIVHTIKKQGMHIYHYNNNIHAYIRKYTFIHPCTHIHSHTELTV